MPLHVEAAVFTALEKLPADRFATSAEFAAALTDGTGSSTRRTAARVAVTLRRRSLVPWGIAVVAAGLAVWGWSRNGTRGELPVERRYLTFGDSVHLQNKVNGRPLALSSDGSLLVFVGDTLGRLWIKRRDAVDPVSIAGTEAATSPVFSPDDQWIAYVAHEQVMKVRVTGGPTTKLADSAADAYGIAWLDDGTIVYTNQSVLGLRRVSASGGLVSVALADTALHGLSPLVPTPLPRSRGVLFQQCASNCVTTSLHVLDLKTGKQKLLVDGAVVGWYLPSGHLLYLRNDGIATEVPFDLGTFDDPRNRDSRAARHRSKRPSGAVRMVALRQARLRCC